MTDETREGESTASAPDGISATASWGASARTYARHEMMAKVLRAMRYAFNHTVAPNLETKAAIHSANEMSIVLDYLIEWIGRGPDEAADLARLELIDRHDGSLSEAQLLSRDFPDSSLAAGALAAMIDRFSAERNWSAIAELAPELASIENDLLTREREGIAADLSEDAERMSGIEIEITSELVDAYVARNRAVPQGRTVSITRVPGGYSKDTILVANDRGGEFVIRRDLPFGPTPASAAEEFGLLDRLARLGFPVPRPLAAEFDPRFLGKPFLVVEKVRGQAATERPFADEEPAVRRKRALQLADLLGRLHAIRPQDVGLESPKDPRDAILHYIDSYRQWWCRSRVHPSPLCELAFAWLARNAPRSIARVVIVHGDAGPHNMLIEDGEVSALLDWEFAHVGDPAEDLETARLWLGEDTIDWVEFEAAYLASGGAPINHEASLFYEVWRSLRNIVLSEASWGGFLSGRYPVLKTAKQGVSGRRMFLYPLADVMRRLSWN